MSVHDVVKTYSRRGLGFENVGETASSSKLFLTIRAPKQERSCYTEEYVPFKSGVKDG